MVRFNWIKSNKSNLLRPRRKNWGKLNLVKKRLLSSLILEKGASEIKIRVAPGMQESAIDIGLDNIWGPTSMGAVQVPKKKGQKWITVTAKVDSSITGVHAIWLRFSGKGKNLGVVDRMKFMR